MSGRIFPDMRSPRAVAQPQPLVPFAIPFEVGLGCAIVRPIDADISLTGISVFAEPEDPTDVISFRVHEDRPATPRDATFSVAWLSKLYPAVVELQVPLLLAPRDRLEIASPKCRAFGVLHGVARGHGWTPPPLRSP